MVSLQPEFFILESRIGNPLYSNSNNSQFYSLFKCFWLVTAGLAYTNFAILFLLPELSQWPPHNSSVQNMELIRRRKEENMKPPLVIKTLKQFDAHTKLSKM